MIRTVLAAFAALTVFASIAQARPHADGSGSVTQFCRDRVCPESNMQKLHIARSGQGYRTRISKSAPKKSAERRHAARHPAPHRANALRTTYEARIVPNVDGCPPVAFCACGASVKVFGRPIRSLWPSEAWFRFPAANPAPGMVAVRSGHVFVILEVVGPGLVLAWDANSGAHRTRVHLRRLAGFSVRNPHAGRKVAWLR